MNGRLRREPQTAWPIWRCHVDNPHATQMVGTIYSFTTSTAWVAACAGRGQHTVLGVLPHINQREAVDGVTMSGEAKWRAAGSDVASRG